MLVVALATLGAAAPASAAPPADDWSLERRSDDPELVRQRLAKLHKRPFDRAQWRALEKALGKRTLARRILGRARAQPKDVGWAILAARAHLVLDDPATAAALLAKHIPKAGSQASRMFDLRIDAMVAADAHPAAVSALRDRAAAHPGARERLLRRAYELASRAGLRDAAFELAGELTQDTEGDDASAAYIRLARAAGRAGRAAEADDAYAEAIQHARPRERDGITVERARARASAGSPGSAAELLWPLLEDPKRGRRGERDQRWATLVATHRQAGTADMLVRKLDTWLRAHPGEAAAWRALAGAQQVSGGDPIPAWTKATELDPRDARARAALVHALEAAGKTREAIDAYKALGATAPGEVQTGLDLASRLVTNGQREAGLEVAASIEARAGRRAHTLLLLLDFYNTAGEQKKALTVARRLVKGNARNPEARIALGEQLYQMGQAEAALEQWSRLPKLIRPPHEGWARYAEILSEHGRNGQAAEMLGKALSQQPNEPRYLRLQAVLAEERRRPTEALNLWGRVRAEAKRPDQRLLRDEARTRVVELLVSGGGRSHSGSMQLARTNALRGAMRTLERGTPVPDALEAGRFLAEYFTRMEQTERAVQIQRRLIELAPEEPERLAELAAALRRNGDTAEAIVVLEQLLEKDPSRSADVLSELSELAFEARDDDVALARASEAAKRSGAGPMALVRLGELHERRGDLEQASRAYRKALEGTPGDAKARLRLAELELLRGDQEAATSMFREILERGGPPEVLRQAGRRALDLAEVSGDIGTLVGMAVRRTQRDPGADEPREFLLESLDRASGDQVDDWLRDGERGRDPNRVAGLRRPLVDALTRGPVGTRLRAAQHLGQLQLPDTAVPLARMGARLSAPRDATRAVRDAFDQARAAALRAAGEQDDPRAVEVFSALLQDRAQPASARIAAAWGLARTSDEAGVKALIPMLDPIEDQAIVSLACIAIARQGRTATTRDAGEEVSGLARDDRRVAVRHACTYAEAALTPDHKAGRLTKGLDDEDPLVAAIAAWRLGQMSATHADAAIHVALFRRFVGPPGLARDAAGAALANLVQKDQDAGGSRGDTLPTAARGGSWGAVIERWLRSRVAPNHDPVPAAALAEHGASIAQALRDARSGTRAERLAASRARCELRGKPAACLVPLAEEPVPLPSIDKAGRE